jgi:hypothetical protein
MTDRPRAKVFQSPKYIQAAGSLSHIGAYMSEAFPACHKAALILSPRSKQQYLQQITKSVIDPGAVMSSWSRVGDRALGLLQSATAVQHCCQRQSVIFASMPQSVHCLNSQAHQPTQAWKLDVEQPLGKLMVLKHVV